MKRAGPRVGAITGLIVVLMLVVTSPSYATPISIGPQAMEGDLKIAPGTVVKAGISFTMTGSHPAATIQFVGAQVTFANVECVTGSGGGSFTIPLGSSGTVGPYDIPSNNTAWFPTGDQSSALSYQGSIDAPDLCEGGTMSLRNGGAFTGDAQSSDAADPVNVRFHYSANGSSGSWSATKSVVPSSIGSSQVPASAAGVFGFVLVIGLVFAIRSTTKRRRDGRGRVAPQPTHVRVISQSRVD